MIGLEKLSTIKAKLRQAFAAGGYNPIVDLDREIDELKISKSADAGELESLETFRRALAQVVDDKPAQSSRFSNEQRASKGSQEKGVAMRPKARSAKKEEIGQELEAQLRKSIAELDCAIRKLEKPAAAAGKAPRIRSTVGSGAAQTVEEKPAKAVSSKSNKRARKAI